MLHLFIRILGELFPNKDNGIHESVLDVCVGCGHKRKNVTFHLSERFYCTGLLGRECVV